MHTVATTWDGIELWLVGLPFPAQVAIVMVVVLPLAALAAVGLDRVVGAVSAGIGRGFARLGRHEDDRGAP